MGLGYFKLVEAEEIPSGKDMQRLKVSCKEGKPLSGDKVCEKGRQVKQVILRDHSTVWRKLFPNGCPSGVSLAEAKYRFMLAMHRRQEEQRKAPPLDESAVPAKHKVPYLDVFFAFGLPARCEGKQDAFMAGLFSCDDDTHKAAAAMDKSRLNRIGQREEAKKRNGLVWQAVE